MKKVIGSLVVLSAVLSILFAGAVTAAEPKSLAENLPVNYEQLTAVEFISAVEKSASTCIIPFGVLEKHGPHLPLGTDLLDVREVGNDAYDVEFEFKIFVESESKPCFAAIKLSRFYSG